MGAGKRQWIVAILALTMCLNFAACAEPVYIYGGDFTLRIPANPDDTKGWMDDAIIDIPDHFQIYDLDVSVSVTHSHVFDLQVYLQSPTGTRLCLNMYDLNEFFNGENYTQTIFDDEAPLSIEQGQPPFTGRFRPESGTLLSVFDGQDAYGPWRLQIYDAYYADTGTLEHLELVICPRVPADLNGDKNVDLVDYVGLAGRWGDQNCAWPGWCEGADLDKNGSVDLSDLAQFVEYWLEGE